MPDTFLTVDEAAKALHLSKFTVRQWVASRRIEHVRFGRAVRIPQSAITRLIDGGTVPERRQA